MKNTALLFIAFVTFSGYGNSQSIKIGTLTWTAKNLDVATFRNGDPIPQAKSDAEWVAAGENYQPALCYYDNDPKNGKIYGKLYNWYAVNDPRGLAPEGFHIPSHNEWSTLIRFLGGEDVAGGKMKSTGTSLWHSPNTNATNNCGFTGLPGGCRSSLGEFCFIGIEVNWCSSSEGNTRYASTLALVYNNGWTYRNKLSKGIGFLVRCLRY